MFHIILTYSPLEKRGTMIGIGNLTTSIAPAIGPTYGGLLTSLLNWNYIFLFLIPVLLVSLVLGLYSIPKIAIEKTGRLDLWSVLGITFMFSGFLLFLNQIGSLTSIFPLALGILGVALFYKRSLQSEPLIRLSVFKNRSFRLFLFGFLVCQFLFTWNLICLAKLCSNSPWSGRIHCWIGYVAWCDCRCCSSSSFRPYVG